MNLWIRSTSKTNLLQARFLTIMEGKTFYKKNEWEYEGYTICNVALNGKYELLGTYKTKERAIEVLDEIEKLIKPITIFQNCQVDKSTIEKIKEIGYCIVNDDARLEQISQAFYQMPEK